MIQLSDIHLLPGRVAIRPDVGESKLIITPTPDWKDRQFARTGIVIALGPPALTPRKWRTCVYCESMSKAGQLQCVKCLGEGGRWVGGHVVPPGFTVGDRVVYVYGQIDVPLPGEPKTAWCAQEEILAVVE